MLGFANQKIDDGTQNVNKLALAIHEIENLLVADTHMKMIIVIIFFTLNNADIAFVEELYLNNLHRHQDYANKFRLLIKKNLCWQQ